VNVEVWAGKGICVVCAINSLASNTRIKRRMDKVSNVFFMMMSLLIKIT
jgi:hypothetical protein